MNTKLYLPIKMIFFISFFILVSCQKEKKHEDPNTCTLKKSSLAGTYVLTSVTYKATPTSPEQDFMFFMEPCEKDDLFTINANGTYTYSDIATKCSPDGTESGNWSLNGNTIISDGEIAGTIEKFDCKSLVLYDTDVDLPGDRITTTITRK
ncbi:MAG: lipocalin family protein [Chitinophagaceae bacterium]